jgi:hypothetical protein
MTRIKIQVPVVEKTQRTEYYLRCPYCHAELHGGIYTHILVMACYHCNRAIKIDWESFKTNQQ